MRKIRLFVDTGYPGCDYEDIIEVDDDTTDEELEEMAENLLAESVSCGWHEEGEED